MTQQRPKEEELQTLKSMQDMIERHIAKGGTVTQCPPGPSEQVTYKNAYHGRGSAKSRNQNAKKAEAEGGAAQAAPADEAAASAEPANDSKTE
jgi:hypothetical protein